MRLVAAALMALALAGLSGTAPALASEAHPTQSELESELICPTCHTPLDESDSPAARDIKLFIRQHIAMGWTKSQITNSLVAQLGPGVLGVPRTHGFDLLAWVLPLGGIVLGAGALAFGARYWSRGRTSASDDSSQSSGLDADDERRVDQELARFDG